MVDLHSHILPGVDDGAWTIEDSLELGRAAHAAGIETIAATPHIRDDHPFALDTMEERLGALRQALREAEIPLEVVRGGEVALSKLIELDDETLRSLCLGDGRYVLVETPHTQAPSLLETALYDLQVRGFCPVLAHPERSLTFLHDRARLEHLVEGGIACSVTAMSVAGGFGPAVKAYTLRMFTAGLVHNIASDAHDARRRPPGFLAALDVLESEFDCSREELAWFTDAVGKAVVDGEDLPAGPPVLSRRPSGWRRMRERVGLA
jgi:protein-tyrosine phosphatase